MRHQLSKDGLKASLGAVGPAAATAIERCVHCGFCLSTCPTYAELAEEADSPRGRIVLMKAALEGQLEVEQVLPHIDGCLGCLACETSCPSGVEYGQLLGPFRELAERERKPDRKRSRLRRLMLGTLESPRRLLWMSRLARLGEPVRGLLPESLQAPFELLPSQWPKRSRLPALTEAVGERRARVLLFPGCVQQVFEIDVHLATIEVLAHCGVEVVVPKETVCCGALAAHVGELDRARALATQNLEVLGPETLSGVDAVVTNVAGCGSGIAEYPQWLLGSDVEERSRELVAKAVDVSEFLATLGVPEFSALERPTRVAMQDACHLMHAQGVVDAPRQLLRQIPGLELCEPEEPEVCCGSAGLYNVEQPEMAARLGRRKARKLAETGAGLVVSGNIGCILQLRRHLADHFASAYAMDNSDRSVNSPHSDPMLRLETFEAEEDPLSKRRESTPPRVMHTMQVIRDAYRGDLGSV